MAEKKADIAKFENYAADGAAAAPAAPKKEAEQAKPAADEPKKAAKQEVPKKAAKQEVPEQAAEGGRIFASPAAKNLAAEKGVALNVLKGSGPNGRIVMADVEDYLASGKKAEAAPAKAEKKAAAAPAAAAPQAGGDYTDIPHTNIRKIIATRLQESKQTIPHYYLTIELNVDKLTESVALFLLLSFLFFSFIDFIPKTHLWFAAFAPSSTRSLR